MRGGGNLHYAVFDVLWLKGEDLRECPLRRRKRILSRLVKKSSTVLSPVFGVPGRSWDLFRAVERLDLESIVAKRLSPLHPRHRLAESTERCLYPDGRSARTVSSLVKGRRNP